MQTNRPLSWLIGILLACLPTIHVSAIFYVNTKCPYVKKVYDEKRKCDVYKDNMGNFLCKVKDSKPFSEIDKDVYARKLNKKAPGLKKEYDKERGCYVWRNSNGDFLGRDDPNMSNDEKFLNDPDKAWFNNNSFTWTPPSSSLTNPFVNNDISKVLAKQLNQAGIPGAMDEVAGRVNPSNVDVNAELRKADANVQQAQAGINEARRALQEAGMGGEYEGLLREAEQGISNYKNQRRR